MKIPSSDMRSAIYESFEYKSLNLNYYEILF